MVLKIPVSYWPPALDKYNAAIIEAWNRLKAENPKHRFKPKEVRLGLARHLRDIAKHDPDIAEALLKQASDFESLESKAAS